MIREFGWVELSFLFSAMRWTLLLSVLAFVGGGVVGFMVALLRVAPVAPLGCELTVRKSGIGWWPAMSF